MRLLVTSETTKEVFLHLVQEEVCFFVLVRQVWGRGVIVV
jgi:hypothetical protein